MQISMVKKTDDKIEDILSSFLSQFYENKTIPALILTNAQVNETKLLEKTFSSKENKQIIIKLAKTTNEINISKSLFTEGIPEPDILIRTGNTHRLSNFLLWQIAYSEIFFEKKLWPDFNESEYNKILNKFKKIKRNFGKI